MENYDFLIERIVAVAGLERAEVERMVEAKRAKLSGLISREGAAQIIAAELKLNFDNIQFKIKELMPGMKKINLVGKIITLFPVREYEKNQRKGKVLNFILADEESNVRVVLWDTNHISLFEQGKIRQNDVVEIENASMRDTEVHLSGFSDIKKSSKVMDKVKTEQSVMEKVIEEVQPGQSVKVRGVVVQMFNPKFFYACPECGKKVAQQAEGFVCEEHGRVVGKEKAIINFVLDDGTETLRIVLFSEQIEKLMPEEDLKNVEKLLVFREDFLGSEIWVSGFVRRNKLFNNLEINSQNVEKVDVDKLVVDLEKG